MITKFKSKKEEEKADKLFDKAIELQKELNKTIAKLLKIDEQAGNELLDYLHE